MKDGVKVVNDLAHQLAISDVHLSMENSRTLEHINTRWKQLQVGKGRGPANTPQGGGCRGNAEPQGRFIKAWPGRDSTAGVPEGGEHQLSVGKVAGKSVEQEKAMRGTKEAV